VPWALHITSSEGGRVPGYYHPTFLYESLWCVGVGFLVIWAGRRFKLGHGRAFALYVAAYCVGRGWIEYMRVDDAHHVLGLRLNDWTAMIVFLLAVLYLVLSAKKRPGLEAVVEPGAPDGETEADAATEEAGEAGAGESAEPTDTAEAEEAPEPESAKAEAEDEAEDGAKDEAGSAAKKS
jgi:hypothetical protein